MRQGQRCVILLQQLELAESDTRTREHSACLDSHRVQFALLKSTFYMPSLMTPAHVSTALSGLYPMSLAWLPTGRSGKALIQ